MSCIRNAGLPCLRIRAVPNGHPPAALREFPYLAKWTAAACRLQFCRLQLAACRLQLAACSLQPAACCLQLAACRLRNGTPGGLSVSIFDEFVDQNLNTLLLQRGFCHGGRSSAKMPDVWDVSACHRLWWRQREVIADGGDCGVRRGARRRVRIWLRFGVVSPESFDSRLQGFVWVR